MWNFATLSASTDIVSFILQNFNHDKQFCSEIRDQKGIHDQIIIERNDHGFQFVLNTNTAALGNHRAMCSKKEYSLN